MIEQIKVGALSTNCYIIYDNNEAIVIDPGYPDEKIAIPEGTREVSEEEFNTLFLEKLVGTEGVPAE